ncbi:MAG: DUF4292 domain-containing protein, partial [Bacteroidota bacterium]
RSMSRIAGVVLMLLFLASCKDSLVNFNRDLAVDYFSFEFMQARAKIRYADGKQSVNAVANIRIKKDSLIWMSVGKVGIEGARLLINPDSVLIIDKLNRKYITYGFEELSQKFDFDIDYHLVESVVLGNLIYPYEREKVEKTEGFLKYDQQLENFLFNNFIGTETKKLEKLQVEDVTTKNTISVNYSDFQEINQEVFPFSIDASINYVEKSKKNIDITIGFSRAQIGSQPLSFPFRAPSKYRRI